MRWWLACVLAGCEFHHGAASGVPAGDGKLIDARLIDAPPDALTMPMCFGPPGAFQLCLSTIPTNQTMLNGNTIDTEACSGDAQNENTMQLGGVTVCVIAGGTITVAGTVQAIGANPLVLVAVQSITIQQGATLSVASKSDASNAIRGASANDSSCTPMTAMFGASANGGGGGGAGASFGGAGMAGGAGTSGASAGGTAGTAASAVTTLRGGCEGGDGGDSSNGSPGGGGAGGDSGGALYVATQGMLTIAGTVTASGAGGYGAAASKRGGGGAGSGGLIVIAAHSLTMPSTGIVIANGGAGGGGSSNSVDGTTGANATTLAAAAGGAGGSGGGADGGNGGAATTAATVGMQATQGGGGGGAGVGIIKVLTTLTLPAAQISPPQS
ncbi:MAG: hypothetical protein ACM31C_32070 [Acidobacteriota bacterium]